MSETLSDYSSEYALLYDIITGHKDYKSESYLLHELIKLRSYHSHPTKSLLSVGCGAGSHEFYLDGLGLSVTGIDTSLPMIKRANSKHIQNSTFIESSINEFSLSHPSEFDSVISLFNVINCLPGISGLVQFIDSAAHALKPNGLFFFECWNMLPCIMKPPKIVKREFSNPSQGYCLTRIARPRLDPLAQKLTINYDIQGSFHNKQINFTSIHEITLFSKIEIEYALAEAGFTDILFVPSLADQVLSKELDDETRMLGVYATRGNA